MPEARIATRRTPLSGRSAIQATGRAVSLAERPFLGKWILRVDPKTGAGQVAAALGFALPVEPLTSATDGLSSLLWMGPDEWMLVTAADLGASPAVSVAAALAGTHYQLVDVSDYYTAIDVQGPQARELLMKLTTLDLHPRAFRQGMVAGSVFGRANAIIWQLRNELADDGLLFRLFVRWSMADYLWCLLAECGREWGLPEQIPVKGETLTVL